jgi:ubiquinone/menaquinone biosynthesis C-methylase UbiE
MKLDAEYFGLDLSETMLGQGVALMASNNVPMTFVLADAQELPFVSESFDIVLNYGAINGYGDPKRAMAEMARVTKPGGLVLFLDEQLYERATLVERLYFQTVLSSHNVIHRCPVEFLPDDIEQVKVHQIYQFYYLCTAVKRSADNMQETVRRSA